MTSLKVVTYWVRPTDEESLPEAKVLLESLLSAFCEVFPEYQGSLVFSQSPRKPRYVFVYVNQHSTGLLPRAGAYLRQMLEQAFPMGEVRLYGKAWYEEA